MQNNELTQYKIWQSPFSYLWGVIRHQLFNRGLNVFSFSKRGDVRFWVLKGDTIGNEVISTGFFDLYNLKLIQKIIQATVRKDTVMLDIGANIGNHALFLANDFSKIHCFEPNPMLAKIIEANCFINDFSHIETHNYGIGLTNAELNLHINKHNLGGSSFVENKTSQAIKASIRNGEEIFKNLISEEKIGFIKIDVEGMEGDVLTSLNSLIEAHHPLITFEFTSKEKGKLQDIIPSFAHYYFFQPLDYVAHTPWQRWKNFLKSSLLGVTYVPKEIVDYEIGFYDMIIALPKTTRAEFSLP